MIQECIINGISILIDANSGVDDFRVNTYATKEPETLEWMRKYFSKGDVYYDVGANIGQYSLYAAKVLHGDCTVYSFEPESQNFASLNQNIYINKLHDSIIPCCLAVTEKTSFGILHINPYAYDVWKVSDKLISGSALHNFGTCIDFAGEEFTPIHKQGVMSISIDDAWNTFGFKFPNHIKIDIDGLEMNVIQGMAETMLNPLLKSVLVEISKDTDEHDIIIDTLGKCGFKIDEAIAAIPACATDPRFSGVYNAIFVR